MNLWVSPASSVQPDLCLLSEQRRIMEQPRFGVAAIGSLLVHIVMAVVFAILPAAPPLPRRAPTVSIDLRKATPLVAPPLELTQTAPNRGTASREVDLQGLLPRPPVPAPSAPPSTTRPAAKLPGVENLRAAAAPPTPIAAPPKLDPQMEQDNLLARVMSPALGPPSAPPPPPPQIQTEERPKLAFEKPGAFRTAPAPQANIPAPPRASVDEAMRNVARGAGSTGLVVGDLGEGIGGLGEALNLPPSPGRTGSSLELLSDPMGVDFRPYLIRILSTVRRNWLAVIPESVKLGQRGRVLIQFAINRDGSVPKLVIATPSGADHLDRAAVAGISASNPFPPLPPEFKGSQVRLQFTFSYNIPSR